MNIWDAVKPWLAKAAPMIGTALGGPFGGAAGALLGNVLGVKDPTPDNIQAALDSGKLDGPGIAALMEAENQFKLQMEDLNIKSIQDLEELSFKDRDSARNREIQVRDHTPAIGFYAITVGFFTLLALMCFHVIPDANKGVLDVMTGSLGTAWIACVGYYYGSSASSKAKDQMLYNSTPNDGGKP